MKKRILILTALTLLVVGVLCGCGCSKDSKFTGKWELMPQQESNSAHYKAINTIKFNSDNTGTINNEDSFTWKVTSYEEPNVIEADYGSEYGKKKYYYDKDNDRLYTNKELNSEKYYKRAD